MKNDFLLKSGEVIKDVSNGTVYLCLKTSGKMAIVSPTSLNEENQWSVSMKETIVVSNQLEDYDANDFEFVLKKR